MRNMVQALPHVLGRTLGPGEQRLGEQMTLQDQNIEQNEIIIEVEEASSRQSLVPMLIAGLVLGIVGMGVALVLS